MSEFWPTNSLETSITTIFSFQQNSTPQFDERQNNPSPSRFSSDDDLDGWLEEAE